MSVDSYPQGSGALDPQLESDWPWPVPESEFPKVGERLRFLGCSEAQRDWGNHADPNTTLTVGEVYYVSKVEVHSWHTKLWIGEGDLGPFNSVCFEKAG